MKKICVVTAARSEYGILKWLIQDLSANNMFEIQLIVTGGHLLKEQGCTINEIISEQTGTSLEKVSKDTDRDYWLNSEEAVQYGLICKVITNRKDLA